MKKVIIASLFAFALVASSAQAATSYVFSNYLRVGSTGNDVVALQSWLVSQNFLKMPAGVAMGYFGTLTKAAVVSYQASVGLPATGFVGPLTVAKLNSGSVMTSTGGTFTCPTGWTCQGPAAPVTGGSVGTITTNGAEGIMTVTQGPLSTSVLNVGQRMAPILTVRVQAQNSDISVQRLNLDLGSDTTIYNKIYTTFYVTDGTNVLSTIPLNSSTVIQSGSDYIASLIGFNFVVPKGTYKDLVLKADLASTIDTSYTNNHSWTVTIPSNGVRGVDGAGIDNYSPSGTISQTITINKSLIDNAQVNLSLNGSTPQTNTVAVTDTTNNQYLGLPVMIFDLYSQNDTTHLKELKVHIGATGTGSVTAAYLYQGSTPIMSTSVVNGVADFTNILDGQVVSAVNAPTTFTIKVDVSNVTGNGVTISASTTASADIVAQNSTDQSLLSGNVTGSAIANAQTVIPAGPQFSLVSAPTLSITASTNDNAGNSTSTIQAVYNVNIQAVGTDVVFGLQGSTSPSFLNNVVLLKNGQAVSTSTYALTVSYQQPSNVTVTNQSFTVTRGSTVTIPVTYSFVVKNKASDQYRVQFASVNWATASTGPSSSTYFANLVAWQTNSI